MLTMSLPSCGVRSFQLHRQRQCVPPRAAPCRRVALRFARLMQHLQRSTEAPLISTSESRESRLRLLELRGAVLWDVVFYAFHPSRTFLEIRISDHRAYYERSACHLSLAFSPHSCKCRCCRFTDPCSLSNAGDLGSAQRCGLASPKIFTARAELNL